MCGPANKVERASFWATTAVAYRAMYMLRVTVIATLPLRGERGFDSERREVLTPSGW